MPTIREQGRMAAKAGVPRHMNPYRNEQDRANWFEGYDEA